jgi:transcriptional regulator with XRE-family HTH domain
VQILNHITDEVVLQELGRRLSMARLEKNLTQVQLAEEAGVSKSTVQRLEGGEVATQLAALLRVCRALDLLERFDALLPEALPGPMARLKQRGKQRRRARRGKSADAMAKKWTWGEPS